MVSVLEEPFLEPKHSANEFLLCLIESISANINSFKEHITEQNIVHRIDDAHADRIKIRKSR
jgi:hypothetical protein